MDDYFLSYLITQNPLLAIIIFFIFVAVVVIIITVFKKKEGFLSGGTISQLFAKDEQDLALNGNEIIPYTSGDFKLQWYQPTQVNHPQRGALTPATGTKFYLDAYTGEYVPMSEALPTPAPVSTGSVGAPI